MVAIDVGTVVVVVVTAVGGGCGSDRGPPLDAVLASVLRSLLGHAFESQVYLQTLLSPLVRPKVQQCLKIYLRVSCVSIPSGIGYARLSNSARSSAASPP